MNLLLCAAADTTDVSRLVQSAREKLKHLPEVTLVTLWARVQREFQDDGFGASMPRDAPFVPPSFLSLGTRDEIASTLALYVFEIKPRLVVWRFSQNVYSVPLDSIGPARVLALNTNDATIGRELVTVDIARGVSRFAALWSTVLNRKASDLAELLGLPSNSRLLAGTDAQDAAKMFKEVPSEQRHSIAVYELQHLILMIQRYSGVFSPLNQVLLQHKLGLEVTLPASAKRLCNEGELVLQKELCKFLLERGIYSEGTKFGPFEADLLANVQAHAYVLEVKLFPAGRPPTTASLKASVAQLQDYMDRRVARPRGVLVIYNFSSTLLVGPHIWLKGRYWITPINLGSATGSRRRRSLAIEESKGPDVFTVHQIPPVEAHREKTRVPRRKKTG